MLENQKNQSDNHGWEVKVMLFNTMVIQVLLCELEVWGDNISLNTWNEITNIQKMFFIKTIARRIHDLLCYAIGNMYAPIEI